jgi:hypothetical protein
MGAPRKFDWDKARRLRKRGWTYAAIAREAGVTEVAVLRVCNPDVRARMADNLAMRQQATCEECGGPCSYNATNVRRGRTNPDGRTLCRSCRYTEMRSRRYRINETTGIHEARCSRCKEWQPINEYTRNALEPDGIHLRCSSCQTTERTAYRQRHKVPCEGCGTPVEGRGRPNSRTGRDGTRIQLDPNRPFLCPSCSRPRSKTGQAAA